MISKVIRGKSIEKHILKGFSFSLLLKMLRLSEATATVGFGEIEVFHANASESNLRQNQSFRSDDFRWFFTEKKT